MNMTRTSVLLAAISAVFLGQSIAWAGGIEDPEERRSYALGVALGKKLRSESIEVDVESYTRGLEDALSGGDLQLTDSEQQAAMQAFQRELRLKQAAYRAEQFEKAKALAKYDPNAALIDIEVLFKLDERLTRGVYMGDRWVSPEKFTGTRQAGAEYTLDLRAQGLGDNKRKILIKPEWTASDPEMVQVTPAENGQVRISIAHEGESHLTVAANGVSKRLHIKATGDGETMLVEVTQ
ncbi:FKBP-type peptidyl-prolyl cis-trans isomerase N-terminal domain-containing protein [Microbulbifer sp. SA54]|uniref:FKBP-type peptidyl-prolyl cis-trans isomerase N-terminal domain-containing protein n=1 Tax=Microbulbifer sp. SA54 TaxID=3401577 RepID=UPI003AAACE28